eukprot:Skav233669  [mRNA]  locus=scaffold976:154044:160853:- [translate_table: standard]
MKIWHVSRFSLQSVCIFLLPHLHSAALRCTSGFRKGVRAPQLVVSSSILAAMAQKITCRPLKGDIFEVEVSAEASVADLKKSISEKHAEMPADQQKLIHQGKILDDKTPVKDIGIKEGEFVVVMVAKAEEGAAPQGGGAEPAPGGLRDSERI